MAGRAGRRAAGPTLLQLALLGDEWADTLRPASPPAAVQRLLARILGPLARRRRLRGAHPELEERILIGRLGEPLPIQGPRPELNGSHG